MFKITFGEEDMPLEEHEVPWTRLASCELFEEIGRGGMGVVYRARQRGLDRVVAVKVLLRAQFAGAEERERFHREAQAAARLKHPGIVSIIDVGEDDGVPWFSMEHIAGKSLEQLGREHPMQASDAAKCVQSIAQALQHAHENGVLHRDLKPSNILLDEENTPHITDFGIARIATSSTTAAQLTRTGQMLGSPGDAAPEQALAGSAEVRTDVYGLGALLYHLLTGRPPFQGPTLDAILVQLRENEPLSPRKLNPSVPRDLETICLKCLQKAPEARYATATAVADDVGRFLDGGAILARPISLPGRLWRWTRRHPGIAAMLVIIVLLVGGIIGGSLAFARHQARMEHRTSLISEARSLRQTRLAGSRTEAVSKLREAGAISPSDEIRNETIACLILPEIGRLSRERLETPNLTRSADGMREAVFDANGLLVRETVSKREIARLSK
ncbi:MAG: serine/threonine-protein kinase, partial [bacterium]